MRSVIFLILPFVVLSLSWKEEASFEKLRTELPTGWLVRVTQDSLVIYNPEPLWILNSNYVNAPQSEFKDDEANQKRIVENGLKTYSRFSFLLKSKRNLKKDELAKANYYSRNYALYQTEAVGFDSPYARCYPWSIEKEATEIYFVTLKQVFKSGIGPEYPIVNY